VFSVCAQQFTKLFLLYNSMIHLHSRIMPYEPA
jgi:hypothetical protein